MVVQLFTSFFVYFYAIKKQIQLLEKRRKTLFLLNDILFLLILPFNMKQSALKLKQKQPYAYHIWVILRLKIKHHKCIESSICISYMSNVKIENEAS